MFDELVEIICNYVDVQPADVHEADAENAEAADGGQDGKDVDCGAVVQLDDALASDEDADDASDMACSNEETAAGDADDADAVFQGGGADRKAAL